MMNNLLIDDIYFCYKPQMLKSSIINYDIGITFNLERFNNIQRDVKIKFWNIIHEELDHSPSLLLEFCEALAALAFGCHNKKDIIHILDNYNYFFHDGAISPKSYSILIVEVLIKRMENAPFDGKLLKDNIREVVSFYVDLEGIAAFLARFILHWDTNTADKLINMAPIGYTRHLRIISPIVTEDKNLTKSISGMKKRLWIC